MYADMERYRLAYKIKEENSMEIPDNLITEGFTK